MRKEQGRIIMHVDVNSAFLSWQAAYNQQIGVEGDIRDIPAVIGGNEKSRHGIVLAKSLPAKKLGIQTGESLMEARMKCKDLVVVPPNYPLYMKGNRALIALLREYAPKIEVFSIDECFIDYTGMEGHFGPAEQAAHAIKERIHKALGFTVNVGVSTNKLLAKQAGELQKPNKVNTLYPEEIEKKLWPLPVEELFMVGRKTKPKLNALGIYTIGDLAQSDYNLLSMKLKSHGRLIYQYANGIDASPVHNKNHVPFKSVGNGSTISFDVEDRVTAHRILLSLVETTAKRLREGHVQCRVVSIGIKDCEFRYRGHQRKLLAATNITKEIYRTATDLFDDIWDGNPIRQFNLRLSELVPDDMNQLTFFDQRDAEKMQHLDQTIDTIREKHGDYAVMRGAFLHSGLKPMLGGFGAEDYPVMSSGL